MRRSTLLADLLARRNLPTEAQIAAWMAAVGEDPAAWRQLRAMLIMEELLSRRFDDRRADFPNRVQQAIRSRATRQQFVAGVMSTARHERAAPAPVRLPRVVAMCAVLVMGIGLAAWALLGPGVDEAASMPSPTVVLDAGASARVIGADGERALQSGGSLHQDERLLVDSGTIRLQLAERNHLRFAAGSYRWQPAQQRGLRAIHIQHGWVHGDLPDPLRQPLQLHSSDCVVRVTGTVFTVQVDDSGSAVSVAEGAVVVTDLHRGGQRVLAAGERRSFAQTLPTPAPAPVRTIFDGADLPDGWQLMVDQHQAQVPRLQRDRRIDGRSSLVATFPGDGSWFMFDPPHLLDWQGTHGLLLTFRGEGGGRRYAIEIADVDSGESPEHFTAILVDDVVGWREVAIPWSGFRRRNWQPHANAPDSGLSLSRIHAFGFHAIGAGTGELVIDRIALSQ